MTIRGWCPSLHEPMATGDGLLVRVKPRGGVLVASDLRLIAREAAAWGSGVIELTGRGNLQIRGLQPDSVAPFARAMVAAGLASADQAAERRRNVIATPLADLDPAAHPATGAITAALETALEADATLETLPAKFGFVVDGGGVLPPDARMHVRVRLRPDHAEIASDDGSSLVPTEIAVAAALHAAHNSLSSWRERAGVRADAAVPPIGAVGAIAFGAGLLFGSAPTSVWSALADLADLHSDGKLRLTHWRTVLMAGVAPALQDALAKLGLITNPDDPRLRVAACPGQPGCASATVATRALATRLRPPTGVTIHVSGCDKGCAHPGSASLTLVGRDGRFDLVRNGHAGDTPAQRSLIPAEVLAL